MNQRRSIVTGLPFLYSFRGKLRISTFSHPGTHHRFVLPLQTIIVILLLTEACTSCSGPTSPSEMPFTQTSSTALPQPADNQFIPIGKRVQSVSSVESGQQRFRKISLVNAVAVPIPTGLETNEFIIKPVYLVVNDSTVYNGKTLPVFVCMVVSPQYFGDQPAETVPIELNNVTLQVGDANTLSLGRSLLSAEDSPLFLLITVNEQAIQQFQQYYVGFKFVSKSQGTLRIRSLSVPTYEYQWATTQGTMDIQFRP